MYDVFILGAGFSRAISEHMPTMKDLSIEVIERLKQGNVVLPPELRQLGDNIELWMSYLSQSQPWLTAPDIELYRSIAFRMREQISQIIDERTSLASAYEAPIWLSKLIRSWHEKKAVVITLNYDTLIERAAKEVRVDDKSNKFHPSDIYPSYFTNIASRSGEALWAGEDRHTFIYLKLHGSSNWYYSGREEFYGETIFFADVPELGVQSETTRDDQSRLKGLSKDKAKLIIPPVAEKTTYFNNETVRALWREAGEATRNAESIFIVGYSLPNSDLGMRLFLSCNQPNPQTPVYVVNTDPQLLPHYRTWLPNCNILDDFGCSHSPVLELANNYPID